MNGATRSRAVVAAERLLAERGYLGLSMQQVAEDTGIKKATLYHHFPGGKDELVMTVAHDLLDREGVGIVAALASRPTALQRLESLLEYALDNERLGVTGGALRDASRFLPEAHRRVLETRVAEVLHGRVHGVLRAGVAAGELRPHDTGLSTLLFLSVLSAVSGGTTFPPRDTLARDLVALFRHGLLA